MIDYVIFGERIMKKVNKISDTTFVLSFIISIAIATLMLSTSDQKAEFMSEKFDACKENPFSHKCGISYNPTDEFSWTFSTYWIELREIIVRWDRNSRRELGINERPYPEELSEIMNSPAFVIQNNERFYDCYILPQMSMIVYFRNFGYPQPFSSTKNGEDNFIVWPEIYWFCSPKDSDHTSGWQPWEDLELEIGDYFFGQGPPFFRINNGEINVENQKINISKNIEGQWYMWGPTLPNGYEGNYKPKEFLITEINWMYGNGVNQNKICNEITYTYQEDFDRNCK